MRPFFYEYCKSGSQADWQTGSLAQLTGSVCQYAGLPASLNKSISLICSELNIGYPVLIVTQSCSTNFFCLKLKKDSHKVTL